VAHLPGISSLSAFSIPPQRLLGVLEPLLEEPKWISRTTFFVSEECCKSWAFVINSLERVKMHNDVANCTSERELLT
jgi:hypothetical protein